MNHDLNNQIRTYLKSRRVVNPINVTFTQKQVIKNKGFNQWIDDISSEQNFRHFRNKLNSLVFGNGYRRFNKQLQMLVIRENDNQKRHHLHCIIEQPKRITFVKFKSLIQRVWSLTKFGYESVHIEKPSSLEREDGWLSYIMKDYSKSDLSNSIDFENSTVLVSDDYKVL